MNTVSINHKTKGETPLIHQVINTYPKHQSLTLQNTDKDLPIQIRVDPVTDYTALSVTLGVSILVSSITALVTIWLITKSNRELSANQSKLQEELISKQEALKKNEVKAQNRQEWINKVRALFVSYFTHIDQYPSILQKNYTTRLAYQQKKVFAEKVNSVSIEYNQFSNKLISLKHEIDITLSSKDQIDREISSLVNNCCSNFYELVSILDSEFKSTMILEGKAPSATDISNHKLSADITEINNQILVKIKTLLKLEWEKVKSFN